MTTTGPPREYVGITGRRIDERDRRRTAAQLYCSLTGAALLLAGLLGMLYDSSFDTARGAGQSLDGDTLLGIFEVNGIHNVVHIASGLLLLMLAPARRAAKAGAILFGLVYGAVTLVGVIDRADVLGLFPVNDADHFLHAALSLLGLAAGLASRGGPGDEGPAGARLPE